MKKIKATVYHCDFCTKVSLSAGGMYLHEITCRKNPDNWTPCASCKHCNKNVYWETEEGDIYYSLEDVNKVAREVYYYVPETGYEERLKYHKVTEFTCGIDAKKMYHNKVNRLSKEKREEIISRCDKQMPSECSNYMEL